MAHEHSPRFLKIVEDAKTRIRQTNVDEVKAKLDGGERPLLIDVREESEFAAGHLPAAIHVGKGIIERDIEVKVPDLDTPMILYFGGGFRSALAADNLQKMGYTNVISMDGGIRGWRDRGYPLVNNPSAGDVAKADAAPGSEPQPPNPQPPQCQSASQSTSVTCRTVP